MVLFKPQITNKICVGYHAINMKLTKLLGSGSGSGTPTGLEALKETNVKDTRKRITAFIFLANFSPLCFFRTMHESESYIILHTQVVF